MSLPLIALVAVLAYLLGLHHGYKANHTIVAQECDKLGGFFVHDKTYRCYEVTKGKNYPLFESQQGGDTVPEESK